MATGTAALNTRFAFGCEAHRLAQEPWPVPGPHELNVYKVLKLSLPTQPCFPVEGPSLSNS